MFSIKVVRSWTRSFHVAVVGSGPAGFYSAKYLLDKHKELHVSIIEGLPVPFGLVRFGVAPDHPEVKSVSSQFAELFVQHSTRLRYFGNISVGGKTKNSEDSLQVSIPQLQNAFDAVVLAHGASSDNALKIPGEDLGGVLSARAFVNWYNGHPDFHDLGQTLNLSQVTDVVVVGQGNVAIDCARILTMNIKELEATDISSEALDVLRGSAVQRVTVIGRRGHVQAAFTIKELRELIHLAGVRVVIDQKELDAGLTASSAEEVKANRPRKRLVDLIHSACSANDTTTATSSTSTTSDSSEISSHSPAEKELSLRFLLSPVALESHGDSQRVSRVVVERTALSGEPFHQRVSGTGQMESLPAQLVLKSIGYRGEPIDSVPFNTSTHTIPHDKGRVLSGSDTTASPIKGLYVTGWAKRGPTGIVGTNIVDAKETVSSVLEDLSSGLLQDKGVDPEQVLPELVKDKRVVSWLDYQQIDETEVSDGARCIPSRPRQKLLTRQAMLAAIQRPQV